MVWLGLQRGGDLHPRGIRPVSGLSSLTCGSTGMLELLPCSLLLTHCEDFGARILARFGPSVLGQNATVPKLQDVLRSISTGTSFASRPSARRFCLSLAILSSPTSRTSPAAPIFSISTIRSLWQAACCQNLPKPTGNYHIQRRSNLPT